MPIQCAKCALGRLRSLRVDRTAFVGYEALMAVSTETGYDIAYIFLDVSGERSASILRVKKEAPTLTTKQ